jgi:shikimate dehydrogenase
MKRLAVLGQPIAHSLSPAMFAAAFEAAGLAGEWSYEAVELSPDEFETGVRGLLAEGYVGANVTIPHKEAALALADERSQPAHQIGAANTLSFGEGRIRADNTDAPGLLAALPSDPEGARALVLGAGGAARAAIWALREAGAAVSVWNRTAERAAAVAAELGVRAVPAKRLPPVAGCDLLVNATAVGLEEAEGASNTRFAGFKALALAVDQISDRQVVVDLVYGSAETELVRAAKERGAKTIDGGEILVRQGAASFTIWTGLEAPLATMRRAVQSRST